MNKQGNNSQAEKPADPFSAVDAPIKRSDDQPVAVGRVVVGGADFRGNVPGERVCKPAKKGAWLAQKGLFRLEIASVRPSELDAAGGVDAWLAKNPSKDKMTKEQRKRLPPIPGKVEEETIKPWDFMEVDE